MGGHLARTHKAVSNLQLSSCSPAMVCQNAMFARANNLSTRDRSDSNDGLYSGLNDVDNPSALPSLHRLVITPHFTIPDGFQLATAAGWILGTKLGCGLQRLFFSVKGAYAMPTPSPHSVRCPLSRFLDIVRTAAPLIRKSILSSVVPQFMKLCQRPVTQVPLLARKGDDSVTSEAEADADSMLDDLPPREYRRGSSDRDRHVLERNGVTFADQCADQAGSFGRSRLSAEGGRPCRQYRPPVVEVGFDQIYGDVRREFDFGHS